MDELVACPVCSLVQHAPEHEPGTLAVCSRCGARLRDRKEHGLEYTLAFTLAALILYVPANLYPILRMEWYGAYSENTVWQRCQKLFEDGQWLVAAIVFLASIVIPLLKLLGLFFPGRQPKVSSRALATGTDLGVPVHRRDRSVGDA